MRRHTFDPVSFILGALFGAVGLTFLFGNADLGNLHLAVLWPVPLILVGMLMLISTIQRRVRHDPEPVGPVPGEPETEHDPAELER
jgi:hypothetical protein